MLLESTPAGAPNRRPIEQICSAGERARGLVRQLLAFSRKQALDIQSINIFFPAHSSLSAVVPTKKESREDFSGKENIVIVEDNNDVRSMTDQELVGKVRAALDGK